jgi:flagellar hook-associated protein 3 FlgL
MRVTETNIADSFLNSVNKNRERIVQLQTQLATGKRVNKSSDDPQAAESILRLKSMLSLNEQYQKNVGDAQSVMEMTEGALDSFANVLLEMRELVTRASNGTHAGELGIYADRIDSLLDEAVNIANTKFGGKYIFGGTQTLDAPFIMASDRSAVTPSPKGITGSIQFPVSEGLSQVVNIDGQEAFQGTAIFQAMIQLRDDLRSGQFPTVAQKDSISSMYDYVLGKGSKAGSILQSLDALNTHLTVQKTQLEGLLSIQQDADVAESIMKLKHDEIMLDAALNTASRILPKTLLDYLR